MNPASPQWTEALESANALRLARVTVKRLLREGRMSLTEAITDESVQSMLVLDLVLQLPRVRGRGTPTKEVRALRLLREVPVSSYRQVRELTDRQRMALIAAYARKEDTK